MIKLIREIIERFLIKKLRYNRLKLIDELCNHRILTGNEKIRILEIGCGNGVDLIKFLNNRDNIELYGIDIDDTGLKQDNFKLIVQDAETIDFPDKFFDFVISLGVLEHIQPIEKLSRVAKEINRVGKNYVINVPAISSIIETHTDTFLWHLRDPNKKKPYSGRLNFFNDEVWLQFEGFNGAKTLRKNFCHFC